MPSFEIFQSKKGFHVIDKESWPSHLQYSMAPAFKTKLAADREIMKRMGFAGVEVAVREPEYTLRPVYGDDGEPSGKFTISKITADMKYIAGRKQFESEEAARKWIAADLKKLARG